MPEYKVVSCEKRGATFTTSAGHELQPWNLTLQDSEGNQHRAQRNSKPDGAALSGVVNGTLTPNGDFPAKFKLDPPAGGFGGGGGPRQMDPKVQAQIIRQHGQHMALLYIAAKGKTDFEWTDFIKLVDAFDADVRKAGAAA